VHTGSHDAKRLQGIWEVATVTTPSGLQYKDIIVGTGEAAAASHDTAIAKVCRLPFGPLASAKMWQQRLHHRAAVQGPCCWHRQGGSTITWHKPLAVFGEWGSSDRSIRPAAGQCVQHHQPQQRSCRKPKEWLATRPTALHLQCCLIAVGVGLRSNK
jgi:hypothetical protein